MSSAAGARASLALHWCHVGAIVAHVNLAMYVESLREQLAAAADSSGADSRAVVERLVPGLEAAMRLVLLEALSAAADEITSELAPGSVKVRLRGRDPDFVVTMAAYDAGDAGDASSSASRNVV